MNKIWPTSQKGSPSLLYDIVESVANYIGLFVHSKRFKAFCYPQREREREKERAFRGQRIASVANEGVNKPACSIGQAADQGDAKCPNATTEFDIRREAAVEISASKFSTRSSNIPIVSLSKQTFTRYGYKPYNGRFTGEKRCFSAGVKSDRKTWRILSQYFDAKQPSSFRRACTAARSLSYHAIYSAFS